MKTVSLLLSTLISLASFSQTDALQCADITRTFDDFEKEATLSTPVGKSCTLIKTVSKKGSWYYLRLESAGYTVSLLGKGVKLILSNKQVVSFPAQEIDIEPADGAGFTYSAFITLAPDKIQLLKKYDILKWKLYIYEGEQSESDAADMRIMANCLSEMK